jgi:hypothetical protein
MDPIYPIGPVAPGVGPIPPLPGPRRVDPDPRRDRGRGGEARRAPPKDRREPGDDAPGEAPHIDITA